MESGEQRRNEKVAEDGIRLPSPFHEFDPDVNVCDDSVLRVSHESPSSASRTTSMSEDAVFCVGDTDDRQLGPPHRRTGDEDVMSRIRPPGVQVVCNYRIRRRSSSFLRDTKALIGFLAVWFTVCIYDGSYCVQGQQLPRYIGGGGTGAFYRGSPCQNFTTLAISEHEGHFFSPNYPNPYPKNVECQFQITAPPGKNIKLDFRGEFFELEPSDRWDHKCEDTNDYLEVRDGAHGYSTLRGRFCGTDFPEPIISSDRHLWLSFKSDDNIEMRGFQGVYTFVNNSGETPDREACRIEVSGIQGIINYREIPESQKNFTRKHSKRLDCTWVIRVDEGYKILLSFLTFSLQQPNECGINFMDIYGEKTNEQHNLHHFCGSMAESTTTPGNLAHVRFVSEVGGLNSKFNLSYNAIRDTTSLNADSNCYEGEFDCTDGTCIAKSLLCNGIHNCKFMQDEMESECKSVEPDTKKFAESHILVIMTIGCMLLGGMCFIMVFNCVRKLRSDHREYKERRSAEASLDRSRPASAISTPSQAPRRSMRGSQQNLVQGGGGSRPPSTAPGAAMRSSTGSILGSRGYLYQQQSVAGAGVGGGGGGGASATAAAIAALPPPPPPSVTDPYMVYPASNGGRAPQQSIRRQTHGQGQVQRQDTYASSGAGGGGMPRAGSASQMSLRAPSRQTLTKETQTPTARSSASPSPSSPRSSLSGDEDDDMGSSPPPFQTSPRYAHQPSIHQYPPGSRGRHVDQNNSVYYQQQPQDMQHSRGPSESSDERLLIGGRMKSFRPPSGSGLPPLPAPLEDQFDESGRGAGPFYHPPQPPGPAQVWEPMPQFNNHGGGGRFVPQIPGSREGAFFPPHHHLRQHPAPPPQQHGGYYPSGGEARGSQLGKSPSVRSMPAGDLGHPPHQYYSTLPHNNNSGQQPGPERGSTTMPRYRAEAVIQMGMNQGHQHPSGEGQQGGRRPHSSMSHTSTKSAPDVIVLH